jgi:hypothetical protein
MKRSKDQILENCFVYGPCQKMRSNIAIWQNTFAVFKEDYIIFYETANSLSVSEKTYIKGSSIQENLDELTLHISNRYQKC